MATRASVIFKEKGKAIAAFYKHWDGGVEGGLGDDLSRIINEGKLGNGIGGRPELGDLFNGSGCLFATIIAKLKSQPGDVYICAVDQVAQQGEEYIYEVDVIGDKTITLKYVKHEDWSTISGDLPYTSLIA